MYSFLNISKRKFGERLWKFRILFGLEALAVIWCGMYSIIEAESCKSVFYAQNDTDKNYLKNHVIRRIWTETESLCRIMCYNTDTCVSYNYKKDTRACEISDSDHIQHPQDLVMMPGYVYMGTENGCQNNSCPKNSTCRTNIRDESKHHWCVCPAGFQGLTCNEDIDECQTGSAKCPESSTCNNTIGSFYCQCNVGYKMNDSKCVVDPKIVCEDDGKVHLACPPGQVLNVYWALYGRTSLSVCTHQKMKVCGSATASLEKVISECNGKRTCSFVSNNAFFGDACPNLYKYTEVRYNCTTAP